MNWTPELVERAHAMWREGRSGSKIAAALGNNITRNAVIGLAYRKSWRQDTKPRKRPVPKLRGARERVAPAPTRALIPIVGEEPDFRHGPRIATLVEHPWRQNAPLVEPEPVSRQVAAGCRPPVKILDPSLRALIDAAIAKRAGASA